MALLKLVSLHLLLLFPSKVPTAIIMVGNSMSQITFRVISIVHLLFPLLIMVLQFLPLSSLSFEAVLARTR